MSSFNCFESCGKVEPWGGQLRDRRQREVCECGCRDSFGAHDVCRRSGVVDDVRRGFGDDSCRGDASDCVAGDRQVGRPSYVASTDPEETDACPVAFEAYARIQRPVERDSEIACADAQGGSGRDRRIRRYQESYAGRIRSVSHRHEGSETGSKYVDPLRRGRWQRRRAATRPGRTRWRRRCSGTARQRT